MRDSSFLIRNSSISMKIAADSGATLSTKSRSCPSAPNKIQLPGRLHSNRHFQYKYLILIQSSSLLIQNSSILLEMATGQDPPLPLEDVPPLGPYIPAVPAQCNYRAISRIRVIPRLRGEITCGLHLTHSSSVPPCLTA